MNAILIRVGIDQTEIKHARKLGIDQAVKRRGWNAPVNPKTGEFAYVPILETESRGKDGVKKKPIRPRYKISYKQFKVSCQKFGKESELPSRFDDMCAHLDPDFRYLTYGDEGNKGAHLKSLHLEEDDILAFYAGLAPPDAERKTGKLIYALIGLYRLKGLGVLAKDILQENWHENAHTRREPTDDDNDIVFHGKEDGDVSGRLDHYIDIGEYYPNRHYYLKNELQKKWGGQKAIHLQRGSHDCFDPDKFYEWFQEQKQKHGIRLVKQNNLD